MKQINCSQCDKAVKTVYKRYDDYFCRDCAGFKSWTHYLLRSLWVFMIIQIIIGAFAKV